MSSSMVKTEQHDFSEVKIRKFTYIWTIKNFKYLYKKTGEFVQSPVFSFGPKNKIKWSIMLYPNGFNKDYNGFLSLYLSWDYSSILNGRFKMSVINEKQEKLEEDEADLSIKLVSDGGYGFHEFIKRDRILEEAAVFLSNDSLTIQCEIILSLDELSTVFEKKKLIPKKNSEPSLLEKLFLDEHFSDIKLTATSSGESLPAHRNVLAACSPVFKAMFTHEMLEQTQGEVRIDDAEYKDIKEMLRFIYLNEVENLSSMVFELVKLADKYQIANLIKICKAELINQIAVDNVLKIITIADIYNMEDLKKHAINFGSLHLKDVINSDDFESLMYPQAMKNVLKAFSQK